MTIKVPRGDIIVFTLAAAFAWRFPPTITGIAAAVAAVLAVRQFPPALAGFRGHRTGETILYIRPGRSAIDLLRLAAVVYAAARLAAEAEDASKFESLMESDFPMTVRLSKVKAPEWGHDNLGGQNGNRGLNDEEGECAEPC